MVTHETRDERGISRIVRITIRVERGAATARFGADLVGRARALDDQRCERRTECKAGDDEARVRDSWRCLSARDPAALG